MIEAATTNCGTAKLFRGLIYCAGRSYDPVFTPWGEPIRGSSVSGQREEQGRRLGERRVEGYAAALHS